MSCTCSLPRKTTQTCRSAVSACSSTTDAIEREWFFDAAFWDDYFARLAEDRFNNFSLIFAHQTQYLAPPYPFFVDVPEHPEVKVPGLSAEGRRQNLDALRMITQMAADRGLDFTLGVWQQHADVYGASMVEGLTKDNLQDYSAVGIRRLLEACPAINGVQLRVNSESGIYLKEQPAFWRAIFAGITACGRPIRLDVRSKAVTEDTIQASLDTGLPVMVSTKYWTEHQGMPWHASQIQMADRPIRAHGYNDFLRYPRPYTSTFRLWNCGTNKFLLWGSPEWVRRFAETCTISDAKGFEICAPLTNKGFGNVGGAWSLYADKSYVFYRWEMQRYWYWYLLFGRLGYSSSTPQSVWLRELEARFGASAAPAVMTALDESSKFLPLVTSAHGTHTDVWEYWPEKDTGGIIDLYLEVRPGDVARFYGIKEFVQDYLSDKLRAKLTPAQVGQRFVEMADAAEQALAEARPGVEPAGQQEFTSIEMDVRIQATLARYHSSKMRAAEALAFFYAAGDSAQLKRAQTYAAEALSLWEALVRLTDGVYNDNLIFGPPPEQIGHWKDNLVYAQQDVKRLQEVEQIFQRYGLFDLAFDFGAAPQKKSGYWWTPIWTDYSIEPRFTGVFPETLYTHHLGYGWHSTVGVEAKAAPTISRWVLRGAGKRDALPRRRSNTGATPESWNTLPEDMLYADFMHRSASPHYDNQLFLFDLPNGLYDLRFIMVDRSDHPVDHGPMSVTAQGKHRTDDFVVPAGQTVEKVLRVPVRDGRCEIEFNAVPQSEWIITALLATRVAPHIGHVPAHKARLGTSLPISATVTGPAAIASVVLHARFASGATFQQIAMHEDGQHIYSARLAVPAHGSMAEYYIEATDTDGHCATYPAGGAAMPQRIALAADTSSVPVIEHTPMTSSLPGQPLHVRADVRSQSPLRWVRLYFKDVNQKTPFVYEEMELKDGAYVGAIPGEEICTTWDVMYYIEAMDVLGNASSYPNLDVTAPYVVVTVVRE